MDGKVYDEYIGIVNDVLKANHDGKRILAWYAPNNECLIVAYDKDIIEITE